jgi:serine/threonine protein kinase
LVGTDEESAFVVVVIIINNNVFSFLFFSQTVYFYGVYRTNDTFYMVSELLPLGDLKSLLQQRRDEFKLVDCLHMARSTAAGMSYLSSKSIIHRDLAARNLLVKSDDNKLIVKVKRKKEIERGKRERKKEKERERERKRERERERDYESWKKRICVLSSLSSLR